MIQFSDVFADPAWFLADVDEHAQTLHYLRTREQTIRDSAFLDGRSPIGVDGQSVSIPIADALAWHSQAKVTPQSIRWLAHVSFCGSTLLSRLLQGDRTVLVYREPHVLAKLANLKAAKHPLSRTGVNWSALVGFALQQCSRSWRGEPTLIKPSNWVNSLLSDMSTSAPGSQWAIIETDVEDFLIANLRGGKARLSYSLNLLNHFLSANHTYHGDVLEVERGDLAPTQRLLRLLILNYETQQRLLDGADSSQGHTAAVRVQLSDLQSNPAETVAAVARNLALPLTRADIETAITRELPHHAKESTARYQPEQEAAENARLRTSLQTDIDEALAWRQSILIEAA